MESAVEPPEEVLLDPQTRLARRRLALRIACYALVVATVVAAAVQTITAASGGEVSILIGVLGSDQILGLAAVVAIASITVGLSLIPVRRWWLLLLVPVRVIAIVVTGLAGLGWALTSEATVVPLVSDGCDTGYVVRERDFLFAAWGTVYRADGIFVTAVERTSTDDGYHPFGDGAYAVEDDGESLRVWYSFGSSPSWGGTSGAPQFSLPTLTDRKPTCGLSTGTTMLQMSPTPRPPHAIGDLRAGVDEMLATSLAAAVGPVRTNSGETLDPTGVERVTIGCNEEGEGVEVALDIQTADNAESLTRILETWDAAGYSPDQAIHEDIRYSETLPVARMTIRDSSTIDGLLHVRIRSQCSLDR